MQKQTEIPEAVYKLITYLITYIKISGINDISDIVSHIHHIDSAFDNVKRQSGYDDFSFSFKGNQFFFYDFYGDEDDESFISRNRRRIYSNNTWQLHSISRPYFLH